MHKLVGFLLTVLAAGVLAAGPGALIETRYCGAPERKADGTIKRSAAVLRAFQQVHPCPSTGSTRGACPGWAMNHVIPLACGGCDSVSNLDWMPHTIKACSGEHCRDRYERQIYAATPPVEDTAACTNRVVR